MLFDLRGKRKRLVQVSYAALALIFLVGFVGFSIGSGNAPGGLFDAIGLGGGDSQGSVSSQFDNQIESANKQLAKNPKDTSALLKLARAEYQKGKTGVVQDPSTGQISVSADAHTELGNAADAWSKYLKLNKGKPNATAAAELVNAYILLNDASGAAKTQEIVAENQPTASSYGALARFRYYLGDIAGGDAAAKKAESLAPNAIREQTRQTLQSYRKQGLQLKKRLAKAKKNGPPPTTPGANPLANPLGGLGSAP
jgi:tetratricopeptide (TPR) repeat protein